MIPTPEKNASLTVDRYGIHPVSTDNTFFHNNVNYFLSITPGTVLNDQSELCTRSSQCLLYQSTLWDFFSNVINLLSPSLLGTVLRDCCPDLTDL